MNRVIGYGFILLAFFLWVGLTLLILSLLSPVTSLQMAFTARYSAVVAILISWLVLGRKIVWTSPVVLWLSKHRDALILGPFRDFETRLLNKKQLAVIWIGIVVIIFRCLFPPWAGYVFASGGVGTGKREFIGCHFILSRPESVIGVSPYIVAEPAFEWLAWFCLGVALLCVILLWWFSSSGQRRRAATPAE